jgi:uncharacterized membrane protein
VRSPPLFNFAVISWMAGMLYLPRLFVYHCDAEVGFTGVSERGRPVRPEQR